MDNYKIEEVKIL